MESLYCAACMATLPRPADWKRGNDTMPVRDWDDAVIAHEMGFRYVDHVAMTWGIFAVTQVAGTLYCFGHGYFAMKRQFKEWENAEIRKAEMDAARIRTTRNPLGWLKRGRG